MNFLQTDIPSVQDLLHSGEPFVPFSEFSAQTLQAQPDEDTSRWIENKIRDGKPFVIRGFTQTIRWQRASLNNQSLVRLSSSGGMSASHNHLALEIAVANSIFFSPVIPVRNCQTGRDIKMRLRDLLSYSDDARTGSVREL